jgi:hypothetical protein
MLKLPAESIHLDDLVEIDERVITYIEGLGIVHQSAVQYVCNLRKILDLAHQLLKWTSKSYELRKAWVPVRLALKGKSRGCARIIEFAIQQGRTPASLTKRDIEAWKQLKRKNKGKRSRNTVDLEECHFRTTLRRAGLQHLFRFSLASKNPPKYRMRLKDIESLQDLPDIPEPLRGEILEAIRWKTADEDLADRASELLIRPVTGENLKRYFLELYSFAITVLGIGEIAHLDELIREEIVSAFVDFLQQEVPQRGDDDRRPRCKPQSIISKLSSIRFLTQTYPPLKGMDFAWFRTTLDKLCKKKNSVVQAQKLDNHPDYQRIAGIAPELLALRDTTNPTEADGWLTHDALIFMINLACALRSRNTREARIHPSEPLNIFETEISSELLSQIKMPAWAKELWDKDSKTKFLVGHFLEHETKADHEVWLIFDEEIGQIFKEYDELYRPLLLPKHDPNSTSLFFTRNRKPLSQKALLNLVGRISARSGKRIRVKDFRDLVAARMLEDGASIDEVAAILWHLDPYSTTVRYYVGGYNASDGVVALEDEFAALAV